MKPTILKSCDLIQNGVLVIAEWRNEVLMINKEPNVIIELSILMFYHYVNIKILLILLSSIITGNKCERNDSMYPK